MTLAAQCKCGGEAVFWLDDGQEKHPTAECDSCGNRYRIKIERVQE